MAAGVRYPCGPYPFIAMRIYTRIATARRAPYARESIILSLLLSSGRSVSRLTQPKQLPPVNDDEDDNDDVIGAAIAAACSRVSSNELCKENEYTDIRQAFKR